MRTPQISAIIVVVGIICLAFGLGVGNEIYSGKIATTSILQNSTIIETQTTTAIEKVNVTVTPYCCVDPNLTISTPCSTIYSPNYPPVQRLEYLIETDPRYIASEQGMAYASPIPLNCGSIYSLGEENDSIIQFQSAYMIDKSYTDDCGGVGNFTYYLNVRVHLTQTGYNMSAIEIDPINSSEITYSCSSTIITTQNTTSTITGTTSA